MKKFSRILQYISKYRGKLLVYLLFTLLSTLFGLISLGMLSPFMEILFKNGGDAAQRTGTIHTNAVGSLKGIIEVVIQREGPVAALIVVCILIILSTILKNLFLYWSYYISSPIRSATITFLRNDVYGKILSLPIGYFTERRKG
ncbi:MAG TPA: ABC transporter ATP-binding protein, partial [Puia sp.]|nr:ABC transporter ATP-binding protein [Puia sp.]